MDSVDRQTRFNSTHHESAQAAQAISEAVILCATQLSKAPTKCRSTTWAYPVVNKAYKLSFARCVMYVTQLACRKSSEAKQPVVVACHLSSSVSDLEERVADSRLHKVGC